MLSQMAREAGMTVCAVIHSPGPAAFAAFDDLFLLQTGGTPVYLGQCKRPESGPESVDPSTSELVVPREGAACAASNKRRERWGCSYDPLPLGPMAGVEAYFAKIGFVNPPGAPEPFADYMMLCVAARVEPDRGAAQLRLERREEDKGEGDGSEAWDALSDFHRLWHLEHNWPPPQSNREMEERLVETARAFRFFDTDLVQQVCKDYLVTYPRDVAREFCPPAPDSDRPTPSGYAQFKTCLRRAAAQQYARFGCVEHGRLSHLGPTVPRTRGPRRRTFFVTVVLIHFIIGVFMSALIGNKPLNVLGGYSKDICDKQ